MSYGFRYILYILSYRGMNITESGVEASDKLDKDGYQTSFMLRLRYALRGF